ncbi:MAG: hypothetical protein SFY95_09320 [Planctomycetota bacterium]|nr:hypothetical protein [Planctomycetota bacterium]
MLSPNDHLRLLVELMQPAGPELARRWLAALMLVPRDERERVIASIEARLVQVYGPAAAQPVEAPEGPAFASALTLVDEPLQRDGYIEQRRVEFIEAPSDHQAAPARPRARKRSG